MKPGGNGLYKELRTGVQTGRRIEVEGYTPSTIFISLSDSP